MIHAGHDIDLADEAATLRLGALLAQGLEPGLAIWLSGDLGAGKTTLTRGLLRELGYAGRVKSPTYTLLELYPLSRFNLCHFDLYRFHDAEEWEAAGFRDEFNSANVCLVEWPERAEALLPVPDIRVRIDIAGERRIAHVAALTEKGRSCLARCSF